MKILQLRFKNLNSLAGEWIIDFTAPEYISDGIFAISGPTGAGKSTIMDAICLALYGRTPRLKGISGSSNEIMSRHTGECFSEVVFESQKGQFRCTWSQHRANRKPNRELQNPKHEIAEFHGGKIIESKLRTVATAIEERTGMDFDRFTQSMLLAQGGFAAFLQANADDRAPILEQITGTEIYSEISKLVHERKRQETIKLELLKAETNGITILSDEEETNIKNQHIEKTRNEAELKTEKTKLENEVTWLNGIESIRKELIDIAEESRIHSINLIDFEPNRLVLKRARQAAELNGIFATLSAKRKLQGDEIATLKSINEKVPEFELNLGQVIQRHTEAENLLVRVKQEVETEREKIRIVRELDVSIREKKTALDNSKTEHNEFLKRKIAKIKEKKSFQNAFREEQEKLLQIQSYLTANAGDAVLLVELTGITERLNNIESAKTSYFALEKQFSEFEGLHKKAIEKHEGQAAVCTILEKNNAEAQNNLTKSQQALTLLLGERQLREYRTEHTNLLREMAYLRKIASLENERKQLEDGKPCPLCGALLHPYALGNIPESDAVGQQINSLTILIDEAEKLEAQKSVCEANLQEATLKLNEAKSELFIAENNRDVSKEALGIKLNEKNAVFTQFTELLGKISDTLQSLGIQISPDTDFTTVSVHLNNRLKQWISNQTQYTEIQNKMGSIDSDVKNSNILIKDLSGSMKLKLNELTTARQELEKINNRRIEIFGHKNPDTEESLLSELISKTEQSERENSDNKNKLSHELHELKRQITFLNDSTKSRSEELANDEASFLAALRSSEFENEKTFVSCRLPLNQREELSNKATELDSRQADINIRKKDREERLKIELAKQITEIPLAELVEKKQITDVLLNTVISDIGALNQRIADNISAKDRISQIALRIEEQKTECKRWDKLYDLIGSSDGKKYRNFAQGLTFEIMVSHANQQLMKLTDRYLLTRDENQPLDLNVIDNYQAGEVRSTKNLSGGESFIVSLALALGLSKMASKKVRVDSLFLDEGFGTLDEDTLDTALATLASLRQEGKLIGVISHVQALKDRISTQIIVQKVSGGKSILKGPGCKRISD